MKLYEQYLQEISMNKLFLVVYRHEDKIKRLKQMLKITEPPSSGTPKQMLDYTIKSKAIKNEINKSQKIIDRIKNRGV